MARGAEVIVQAALADGGWAGYADVLVRVPTPSALGDWSYEVVDTKLAQETRGGTILQLCAYSDIVGTIQGRTPEHFHVVTPGEPFVEEAYRFDDYAAYYRLVRGRLESTVGASGGGETYPEPVEHCDVCRWQRVCAKRRRDDDHLSLVAGIRRSQRDELTRHDVRTLTALAGLPLPLPFKPERGSREAMARVREQARIQLLGQNDRHAAARDVAAGGRIEGSSACRRPLPATSSSTSKAIHSPARTASNTSSDGPLARPTAPGRITNAGRSTPSTRQPRSRSSCPS